MTDEKGAAMQLATPLVGADRQSEPQGRWPLPVRGGRRWSALAVLAASLLLSACIALPPSSAEFELAPRLTNREMPLAAESTTGLSEATADACHDVPCLEAWDSDSAQYLRFETTGDAAEYASAIDDATVDRYIVIDYSGRNTPQRVRDDIESTVLIQMPPGHAPWGF